MPNRTVDDNGNGPDVNRLYTDALTAQLGERVTNLNRRQSDLETEMRSGFKQMESSMSAMSTEMRSAVSALSGNIAERNKPQWQAIAVALSFCTIVGGLVYWPIKDDTSGVKASILLITERMVTQKELEWRTARGVEDRQRTESAVKDIRESLVPRAEHERVWQNYSNKDEDLQRQVDELKQAQGSVYGARDVILDLRQRLDRVERERVGPP